MHMYYPVVSQCIHTLKLVETWLDKAEQLAASKNFDVNVLMAARLAPDMKDFVYQVQSAPGYVKAAASLAVGTDAAHTSRHPAHPWRSTRSDQSAVRTASHPASAVDAREGNVRAVPDRAFAALESQLPPGTNARPAVR